LAANPACEKNIQLWYGLWECWNWILEIWEDCDLWNDSSLHSINTPMTINTYLDLARTTLAWNDQGKQCKKCKVIDNTGNYVYEPAECLYTDTPISVMEEEIVPYWWKLWIKDTQVVEDYNACEKAAASYEKTSVDDEKTLLLNDENHPMKCKFAVYNWEHNQGNGPIITFEEDCFNENFGKPIYRYFDEYHKTSSDGASSEKSKLITTDNTLDYWEYKLVLEEVEYKYCDKLQWTWKDWQRYGAVCEVNFAVTKPYVMQISTFGANPVAATQPNFLNDFYDMNWNRIIKKTDLEDIISVDNDTYAISYDVNDKFNEFKEKYWKIAVKVNTNRVQVGDKYLNQIFDGNVHEVKKVPNKSIYFIEWSWTLKLSQDKISKFTSAYTLIVEWMNVEIKWDVLQYAMIVTDKQMTFVDNWPEEGIMSCASGWQVVQWIFVASEWFYWENREYNRSVYEKRCPRWWLHVKWVLIWDHIEDLMDAKRSQLNSWFNSDDLSDQAVLLERRQKIIWWAAVLIEYSPKLWKTLPPWAEIFTESLEVYRK